MSNGARHGLGAVIGLIVTPLIAACLMYGTSRLSIYLRLMGGDLIDRLPAVAALLVAAVLLGLVLGSRVSPLAAIIPGLVYGGVGALWVLAPRTAFDMGVLRELPRDLATGYMTIGSLGLFLVLGAALLASSLMPSRWKAATAGGPAPRHAAPGPYGPPPARSDSPPLPGPQQPAQHGRPAQHAQPAAGQAPPWQAPQQPRYGQGAAPLPHDAGAQPPSGAPPLPPAGSQGGLPPSGAVPFGSDAPEKPAGGSPGSPDESAGEWTQMYGGDDLRGQGGRPPA